MKTIFKSLLYFSFAGLLLTGCAKNDDFSVPNIRENCEEPNIAANKSIGDVLATVTETMTDYTGDDIISGYVVSSDKGGNFYREIYFVDDKNNFGAVLKADIKGSYARYDAGTKIYVKLKGTKVQMNNGMFVIGDKDTRPGKEKFISYLADPTYKKHLVRGCEYLTTEKLEKDFTATVTLKEATDGDKYLGKLITLTGVQFGKDSRGNTYYNPKNVKNSATENIIESKEAVGKTVIFRTVEQAGAFANEKVAEKSGTMTGVMTRFLDTYQFVPRVLADIKLTENVFTPGDGVTPPEEKKEGEGVDGVDQNTQNFVANFSNWSSFILATNKYGVFSYAKEAAGQGKDGKGAMAIKGSPAANDYVYTIENQSVVKGAKTITMWVKGTSAKSLSFNVFRADGTYAAYNLATDEQIKANEKPVPVVDKNLTIVPTKNMQTGNANNGNNNYVNATVNASNWIKITLDLTGVDYNTSGKGNLFAFKVGSKSAYDLLVSDIVFDGKNDGGTTDPEVPGDSDYFPKNAFYVGDMRTTEAAFLATVNDKGLTANMGSFKLGAGPDKQGALSIELAAAGSANVIYFGLKADKIPTTAKKLSFYVKGTSAGSLAVGITDTNNKERTFNVGAVTTENIFLDAVAGANSYVGAINAPKWVKVTVDLTAVSGGFSTTGDFMKLRVGAKQGAYNLLISSFYIE